VGDDARAECCPENAMLPEKINCAVRSAKPVNLKATFMSITDSRIGVSGGGLALVIGLRDNLKIILTTLSTNPDDTRKNLRNLPYFNKISYYAVQRSRKLLNFFIF
jgi:hypothetical protein